MKNHQPPTLDFYQRLKLACNLAVEQSEVKEKGKECHDKKAKPLKYSTKQLMLLEEYYFLGKNTKLSPKCFGPHKIFAVKSMDKVELLLNNKKTVIVDVDRIKPYCLPAPVIDQEPAPVTTQEQLVTPTVNSPPKVILADPLLDQPVLKPDQVIM